MSHQTTAAATSTQPPMIQIDCRFYANQYPQVCELVTAQVVRVTEAGVFVRLLEYNSVEAMIPLAQVSSHALHKHALPRQEGKVHPLMELGRMVCVVTKVDEEKGYIDLNKKCASVSDIERGEEKYRRGYAVFAIMRHVAMQHDMTAEHAMSIAWQLGRSHGSAFGALQAAMSDPVGILGPLHLQQDVQATLLAEVKRRLKPMHIRAKVEVACFTSSGIVAIQQAIRKGRAVAGALLGGKVCVKVVKLPEVHVETMCYDIKKGVECVNQVLEAIRVEMEDQKGEFHLQSPPAVVGQQERNTALQCMEDHELLLWEGTLAEGNSEESTVSDSLSD